MSLNNLSVRLGDAGRRQRAKIGLDVGRGKEKVDLVRLRLSKALLGAAEAQALAAEAVAIEGGLPIAKIAGTEALALYAAAFNGVPDPVFHITARAMGIVSGLAAVEPDPAAPDRDAILDAALDAATALALQPARRRADGGDPRPHRPR